MLSDSPASLTPLFINAKLEKDCFGLFYSPLLNENCHLIHKIKKNPASGGFGIEKISPYSEAYW